MSTAITTLLSRNKASIGTVVYELTDACNQACKFCYNYWKGGECPSKVAAPDYRLARRTLRRLLRQASIGRISFSGGEPMLMPHIHDLAMMVRFAGAKFNLLTNGTLLTDDDIEIFNQLGVGAVQIPILSTDATLHDEITSLKGSWQRAVAAARKVVAKREGVLVPVLIVSRMNLHCVEEVLEFFHNELGAKYALINRFNIGGLGLKNAAALNLTNAEIAEMFKRADLTAARLGMTLQSGVCTPLCVVEPQNFPHILFTNCSTDFSHRPLTVNYRGDVRFCNHSPRVLGNIHKTPLKEIIARANEDSYFSTIPTKCNGCKLWERCRGGCRAASEQLYGTFGEADPIVGN